jgi:polar amino acid transport system substrate-binding protein
MHPTRKHLLGILLTLVALAFLAAGCGGGDEEKGATTTATTTTTGSGQIAAPANIKSAGKLVFCSDITYPPEEFYKKGTTTPQGSDIEIGQDIARRMGVTARFDNTGFEAIIAALLAKKCDLIISGMNDTAERRKQVDFVDYITVGQSYMIRKGNPEKIAGVSDLAGKKASVEVGTTNKDYLDLQSKKLKSQGKAGIDVVTFPKDTDAANALKTGRVDAYFGDTPVVLYYIEQDPSSFEITKEPEIVNPFPVGMAVRKQDAELKAAVSKAVDAMYADGAMKKILAKWKLSAAALKK